MFPEVIETARLRLERFGREHVDALDLYDHAGRSGTVAAETRHLSWDPHATPKESWDVLGRFEEDWEERQAATYAIVPRAGEDGAGEFAGNCSLDVEWEKHAAGLGIWLRKPFWGRGYSGERAAALLALAFDRLDLEVVSVAHVPDNEKSGRAIQKYVDRFGGRREGRFRNWFTHANGEVHDVVRYSISRDEWIDATDGAEATGGTDATGRAPEVTFR